MNKQCSAGWNVGGAACALVLAACGQAPGEADPTTAQSSGPSKAMVESAGAQSVLSRAVDDHSILLPSSDLYDELATPDQVWQPPFAEETGIAIVASGETLTPVLANDKVSITLPTRSSSSFSIADRATGVEVRVQLGGALDVAGEQARGSVVYPAGHAAGDVLLRPTLGAVEDFVLVRTDETKHLDYDVELGADVAGLRLVEDTLELLDATGDPRLRAAPPYVVDANGEKRTAHLNVSGCSYDTDPSAPWGRSVTAPGASSCRVSVDWDSAGLKYPLLVDPAWTTTTAMGTARSHFMLSGPSSSTGSTKNLVLAAGGINASRAVIASAELYNPSSQTWTATASMIFPREDGIVMNRSQTKASVGDDYVLVAGGTSNTSAERYNFKNGTWALTGAMSTSRTSFAAANSDTDKVLVTGGYLPGNCNGGLCVRNTGEIYSFATNAWTASASPTEARFGHTLTRMTDGFGTGVIMVAGGRDQAMALVALTRKYTASSNSWASAGNLSKAAAWHTATWCSPNCAQNGLYVIGGAGASGAVQFYNASANSWSSIGTMYSSTQKIDFSHGAVYYSDSSNVGRILVAGGYTTDAKTLSYTNWATWPAFTQGSMFAARSSFGMSRLANGKVLVAGGDQGANSMTAAADLFTP